MARESGFGDANEMALAMCAGVPWFFCDCTDEPSTAPLKEGICPLTPDQGASSLTYLAAAPTREVGPQSGLLTNACEAGDELLECMLVTGELLVLDAARCWETELEIFDVHAIPTRSSFDHTLHTAINQHPESARHPH